MITNNKLLSRRDFVKKSLVGAALLASASSIRSKATQAKGGLDFTQHEDFQSR